MLRANELLAQGFRLAGTPDRSLVPEPLVKQQLSIRGVSVPESVVIESDCTDPLSRVSHLSSPLVVKAFGQGIIHKSELGAVVLGVTHEEIAETLRVMEGNLSNFGLSPAGFLIEEMVPPGIELVIGATRTPFGITIAFGLGGVMAEIYDDVSVQLAPLTVESVEMLLDGFRSSALLRGARNLPPVDRNALVELLLAIAGADGFVMNLGEQFTDLDCNPVIARPDGATVADARLILKDHDPIVGNRPPPVDFEALFLPASIAVAGVSTKGTGFGNRAIAAYRAFGWSEGLSVIHPSATNVDGIPAYSSVQEIPGGVDYLLAAVPAAACADLVRSAAGFARVVHVVSGGFSEAGPQGTSYETDLLKAARDSGVRIIGPNCIGVYAAAGRQTFLLGAPSQSGGVSVVSQSGGLAGDILKIGAARGLRFAKVISVGNGVDVAPAEFVEHFLNDGETKVIGCYLEGCSGGERLVAAFREAQGRVPVVVMTGGLSDQGSRAAASHTGSLTGDRRIWSAIRSATNVAVVERLEDFIGALVYIQRYSGSVIESGPEVLVVGVGGGASVLAADACDRAGLNLEPVQPEIVESLRALGYGAGTSVSNPIEIGVGPAAPPNVFDEVLGNILSTQKFSDVLLHVNVQSYYGFGTAGVAPLCELIRSIASSWSAPRYEKSRFALVLRNLNAAPGVERDNVLATASEIGLPVFENFDEAAVAIAAAKEVVRGDTGSGDRSVIEVV
ncbi:MAG: CoA-binding protein [Actinobacteria bacterium]|uniref:Unannotated protein n=1 Tax=freshwater metagenome TaxID=449393 RepID=A0A6J6FC42_9ZZZZ|nr:CoA-binding protein [Actinomycetota bacterium]